MPDTYPLVGPGEEHAQRHDPQQGTVQDAKHHVGSLKQSTMLWQFLSLPTAEGKPRAIAFRST